MKQYIHPTIVTVNPPENLLQTPLQSDGESNPPMAPRYEEFDDDIPAISNSSFWNEEE